MTRFWAEPDGTVGKVITPAERAHSDRYWRRVDNVAAMAGCTSHDHTTSGYTHTGEHWKTLAVHCHVRDPTLDREVTRDDGSVFTSRAYRSENRGIGTVRVCTRMDFYRPCPWCTGMLGPLLEWWQNRGLGATHPIEAGGQ